jgi:hypothetical protein
MFYFGLGLLILGAYVLIHHLMDLNMDLIT